MKPYLMPEKLSRRRLVTSAIMGVTGMGLSGISAAQSAGLDSAEDLERLRNMDEVDRYIAVDNKCAWPNLTLMPDGSIVATIFGSPCHGFCEGAAECWISRDGGRTWTFLSVPAPNEPGTNRKDLAAGLTSSGALVVLCSGEYVPNSPSQEGRRCCQQPVVCRSTDGGKTWTRRESITMPPGVDNVFGYGNIAVLPGGRHAVAAFSGDHINHNTAWVFFSDDDGRSWGGARPIGERNYNETTLLALGEGHLLAASRTLKENHTEIFASDDAGSTWKGRGPATLPGGVPADLRRLQDGSILLTHGVRLRGMLGVLARISRDEGKTWGSARVLFRTTARRANTRPGGVDGGYPSSVQLENGTIVTAYYCQRIPMHQRYHMGVVRWRI